MPSSKSAKKRLRQSVKRRARNRAGMSALRTQVKQMNEVAEKGDREAALETLSVTCKKLDQAAAKGTIKKNTSSRTKAGLARAVNKID